MGNKIWLIFYNFSTGRICEFLRIIKYEKFLRLDFVFRREIKQNPRNLVVYSEFVKILNLYF